MAASMMQESTRRLEAMQESMRKILNDLDRSILGMDSQNFPDSGFNGVQIQDELEPIEQEARRLVYGEREKDYAPPKVNWTRIAGMWSALLGVTVTPEQASLCMVAVKLARLWETPGHRDGMVDAIGYILVLQRILEDS